MVKTSVKIEYQDVTLKLIDEPEGRIRLNANDDDIESLAENIKEVGQIQPIVLVKNGKRFEIIAGHRRFLAISSLGHKTIKAIVKEMARVDIALVRASENLLRTDLSPIEEGGVYKDLMDKYGMTAKGIADKFGMAPSSVKDKIYLLDLQPEIMKAIHETEIYINVGVELSKIDHDRERMKHLNYAIKDGCSLETAQGWVKAYQRSDIQETPSGGGGYSPEVRLEVKKIYQACELCEEPVEIQAMKMIRICPGCFKIIVDNLKPGS